MNKKDDDKKTTPPPAAGNDKKDVSGKNTENESGKDSAASGSDGRKGPEKIIVPEEILEKGKENIPSKKIDAPPSRKVDRIHSSGKRSTIDPRLRTLMLHEEGKVRIMKLFLMLFSVMIFVLVASLLYDGWRKSRANSRHINALVAELEDAEKGVKNKEGYERDLDAVKAVRIIDRIMLADKDYRKRPAWLARREENARVAESGFPITGLPKGENFIIPGALVDMVHVDPGAAVIGEGEKEVPRVKGEHPRRKVNVNYEFWIARTEMTCWQVRNIDPEYKMAEWKRYKLDNPQQPAAMLSWHDAMRLCSYITELERKAGRLPEGYEYRLPTEIEWEYACRAGTETRFYWGDVFEDTGAQYANSFDKRAEAVLDWSPGFEMASNDGHIVSAPVASYKPNAWGLYDMSGNVWEWCYDWYNPEAYKGSNLASVQRNPVTVKLKKNTSFDMGTYTVDAVCRVIRGGSWGNLPEDLRSAHRDYVEPDTRNNGIGFRIVLGPAIKSAAIQ